jgi:hypothetical protein
MERMWADVLTDSTMGKLMEKAGTTFKNEVWLIRGMRRGRRLGLGRRRRES